MPGKRKNQANEKEPSPEVSLVESGRRSSNRASAASFRDSSFMKEEQFKADMKDSK